MKMAVQLIKDPNNKSINGRRIILPSLNLESLCWGVLIVVSLAMRFWDLGDRAFGYDESLHAYYGFRLSDGMGFHHSPVMHGPFQFHGTAFLFFLFGDNNYVARLLPASFGTILVALPYFFRGRLGSVAAFATSTLIAFSPLMLFYSRYLRNDIIMAVWTLALVIVLWRFIDEGKHRYLYLASLLLSLSLATKETTFIVIAILGSYLFVVSSPDWIPWLLRKRKFAGSTFQREIAPDDLGYPVSVIERSYSNPPQYVYTPGHGFSYQLSSYRHSLKKFSNPGSFLILLLTLSLPQMTGAISYFQHLLNGTGIILANNSYPIGSPAGDVMFSLHHLDVTKGMVIATMMVILTIWFSCLTGVSWNRWVWLRCALIFYVIWLLLYTTFFTNLSGVGSGIWQSITYWIAQHDVNRGGQPWYYYFIITSIYELLPMVFSFAGLLYYTIRGNEFTRFLVFWAVSSFFIYSIAGEKMPWLLVNILLPMIVLSGKIIGDILTAIDWSKIRSRLGLWLLPTAPLLTYLLLRLFVYSQEPTMLQDFIESWLLIFITLMLTGLSALIVVRCGVKDGLRLVSISFAIMLLTLGFRAGWHASYINGDDPIEMLVYAQDSAEVPKIIDEVSQFSRDAGTMENTHLTIDREIYWGLIWYLRKFDNIDYADFSSTLNEDTTGTILMISSSNKSKIIRHLPKYSSGREFLYIWWPPEEYKPCTDANPEPCLDLRDIPSNLVDREQWIESLDFLLRRKTDANFIYHKAIIYFPEES